ncbi:hypothetical protein ACOMHN_038046 [Nucella lapillus]
MVKTQRRCECPEGSCQACDLYVDQLDDVLRHSMPRDRCAAFIAEVYDVLRHSIPMDRCAAFIAEVVKGAGGSTQLPKGYRKKAYDLVRARGGVCISDENPADSVLVFRCLFWGGGAFPASSDVTVVSVLSCRFFKPETKMNHLS